MINGAVAFLLLGGCAILMLPRRWAPLPLLAGACYMTDGQQINVGPITFTVLRIVIAVGFVRVILRREEMRGGLNRLDLMILAWGAWAIACSVFHQDVSSTLVNHLGTVYNTWGVYFLCRIFCSSAEDIVRLSRVAALILVPVALAMVYEHIALHNLFSIFGGVTDAPQVREGRVRATGPFGHPILAGSVGGVMLPLMMASWNEHRRSALIGILACTTIVVASGSSGPMMTLLIAAGSVSMWPFRRHMRLVRWMAVGALLALTMSMNRPAYYIIQRFEVFGGSTGWYRSRLIESAVEHLDEWWLAGTDYTRHWMLDTNAINDRHTDITNQYLAFCVQGGLPLLFLHLSILVISFSFVGHGYAERAAAAPGHRFLSWVFGCSLFAHAATNISVSYFDQSFLFLYLTIAGIASLRAAQQLHEARRAAPIATGVAKPFAHTEWRREPARAPSSRNSVNVPLGPRSPSVVP